VQLNERLDTSQRASAPLDVDAANIKPNHQYPQFWETNAMFNDSWTVTYAGALRGQRVLDVGAGTALRPHIPFVFVNHFLQDMHASRLCLHCMEVLLGGH
jgi:hypothetical protein